MVHLARHRTATSTVNGAHREQRLRKVLGERASRVRGARRAARVITCSTRRRGALRATMEGALSHTQFLEEKLGRIEATNAQLRSELERECVPASQASER